MPQDSAGNSNASPLTASVEAKTSATADLEKTKDALAEGVHHITDAVKQVADDAAAQAKNVAESKLDAGRDFAAEHLGLVADALRKTGDELRSNDSAITDYVTKAATSVEQVSQYLQTRTLSQLLGDVEGFARREPAMFLGGSFLAGLLGGRFLKSATPAGAGTQGAGARPLRPTASAARPALPAYTGNRPSPKPWRGTTPPSSSSKGSYAGAPSTAAQPSSSPLAEKPAAASSDPAKPSSEMAADGRVTVPNKVNGSNGDAQKTSQAGTR